MARKLDRIIVVDIESTCWDGPEPNGETSEIIKVGLCALDVSTGERQCGSMGVPYPFGPGHLNVKTLFALLHTLPHEVGMDAALKQLALPMEGTHHRAVDDAWNIAAILAQLLSQRQKGIN